MLRAIHLHVVSVFRWAGQFSLAQRFVMRRRQARQARLEDHLLRDIGLTREEAARVAARCSWDAPRHWLD